LMQPFQGWVGFLFHSRRSPIASANAGLND
jgi:hypothetical protein